MPVTADCGTTVCSCTTDQLGVGEQPISNAALAAMPVLVVNCRSHLDEVAGQLIFNGATAGFSLR
jgi:hypothetical protein